MPVPLFVGHQRSCIAVSAESGFNAWSVQADTWRSYDKFVDDPDVAVQVPTGGGKTLIGLVLAEWRRRTRREKALYLCPNKQLVQQVVRQAKESYGLETVRDMSGPAFKLPPRVRAEYEQGECIAVASYASLFNSNPYFKSPDFIALDDVHAAQGMIASTWTLQVTREGNQPLFDGLIELLSSGLPNYRQASLADRDNTEGAPSWIELVAPGILVDNHSELRTLLDAGCSDTDLWYSWSLIREHLDACHVLLSPESLVLCPYLPPTGSHSPFTGAKQRLYLSATLGRTGELQRITGRESVREIPAPDGFRGPASGRRFFLVPGLSLDGEEADGLAGAAAAMAGRALIIGRSRRECQELASSFDQHADFEEFDAAGFESSRHEFLEAKHALLISASRFEGLDLPGGDCRMIVLHRLPKFEGLLERFLDSFVGAGVVLGERVALRVIQAAGRCTRAVDDYALVVVLGEDLLRFFASQQVRAQLHPEMQAEIAFGLEQSNDATVDSLLEAIEAFLSQNDEWFDVDSGIQESVQEYEQEEPAYLSQLRDCAPFEIKHHMAAWDHRWEDAEEHANRVLAAITDPRLRGYRAFWRYLLGVAAANQARGGDPAAARRALQAYQDARDANAVFSHVAGHESAAEPDLSRLAHQRELGAQVQSMEGVLAGFVARPSSTLQRKLDEIAEGIQQDGAKRFQRAQADLGNLLGLRGATSEDDGAPDAWWLSGTDIAVVFEDYTDLERGKASGMITLAKARQVATHSKWIRDHCEMSGTTDVTPVLVSGTLRLHRKALPILSGCRLWELADFRDWAEEAIEFIASAGLMLRSTSQARWRQWALARIARDGVSIRQVIDGLQESSRVSWELCD